MKLRTSIKQPAPRDSTRYISRYLNGIIDYGGEPCTRADAIRHMLSIGMDQPCIDRWLQGYEHAQRRREEREALSLRLYLQREA